MNVPLLMGRIARYLDMLRRLVLKIIPVWMIALFFVGCATVGNEHVGVPVTKPGEEGKESLKFSASLIEDLSSEYFGYLDFTIENNSEKWIVVKVTGVKFDSLASSENIRFPNSEEYLNWQAAMKQTIQISEYNKSIAMGVVAGAGLGLAALSDNNAVRGLGAAAAIGSAGYMAGHGINQIRDSLQMAKSIQANNLLVDSALVLPGLFTKKWLLVNTMNHDKIGYLTEMTLTYTESGKEKAVKIRFREIFTVKMSKWQSEQHEKQKKQLQSQKKPSSL
jgi:hypothetical protein